MVLDALVFDGPGHYGPHTEKYVNSLVPHGVKGVRDLFSWMNKHWTKYGIVKIAKDDGIHLSHSIQVWMHNDTMKVGREIEII